MTGTGVAPAVDTPVDIDLISAREDARRVCLAVLDGTPPTARSLLVRVGETFTTAVYAVGVQPMVFWNIGHAAAEAAVEAGAAIATWEDAAFRIREEAHQTVGRARLGLLRASKCQVVAASRIARAVVTFAGEGATTATAMQIRDATETLAETWAEGRIGGFPRGRVRALLVGAALLEAIVDVLRCEGIISREYRPSAF